MPRVDYKEALMDEAFHPCTKCGSEEFYIDVEYIYVCCECDRVLEALKLPKHRSKNKLKKFKEE